MHTSRGRRLVATAVAALAVTGAVALIGGATTTAKAAFPGQNGRIVFQTNRDGNEEIYSMNPDGANRVNLTRHPSADIDPRWSPPGDKIVFVSNRDGNNEIFTMNADGRSVTQVTYSTVNNRWPSWTNDGRILFHSGALGSRDVYRINADGSGLENLTEGPFDNAWASAAPRGPMIALSRFSPDTGQHLYTLNTLSGVTKMVTPPSLDEFEVMANWSPNGNDLVFQRFDDQGTDLFVVHKDGTELVQLTDTENRTESAPGFSPEGTKIVFSGCTGISCSNYVINRDGTGETEVSTPRIPYLDTFTGDRLDPFWHTILFGTGSSLTQTDGRLLESFTADAQQGGPFDNIDAHVGSNCKLVGDFDVQADFSLETWPSANGVQVTLHAFETGGQVLRESQAWGQKYATWIPPTFTDVDTTDLSGSLRLTRVGSTLAGYYWSGSGWTQIASGATTLDYATIGLGMSSFLNRFGHGAVDVAWDNFRITSGTFSCPSWCADRAPDWQPIGK